MRINILSGEVLDAAIEVRRELGPGLLESAYEHCLCYELNLRGIKFERQVPLPIVHKGIELDWRLSNRHRGREPGHRGTQGY